MSKAPEYPSIKSRTLTITHDIPISRTKVYWDGLREGKVYATKCKKCGQTYYPPQPDCPNCLTSNMEWIQISEGILETFTQAYLKPQGFTHYEQNYIIAIAKVSEEVKVMGWLEEADVKNVKVGMPVEITAKTMPDGFPTIILKPKQTSTQHPALNQ
jgi:uncharacterized OB-fold protein